MEVNGIDLAGLGEQGPSLSFPEVVKGRTVHIDADFLAYQVSFEKVDDPKTFDDMKHNAQQAVELIRKLAAAEKVHLHLTPGTSDKGKRYKLALLKEYQATREGKEKPRYLHLMREVLSQMFPATLHQLCEADDGMSSAQYAAIAAGQSNLSIIATKDKDLAMVPGLHLDWDTGRITDAATFGSVGLRVRGSGQKVLDGYGQKFFWAQMLTGDTADNISGLPKLTGEWLNKYKPTKETLIAQGIANDPNLGGTATGARARKKLSDRPAGLCGPVLAVSILDMVSSNSEAFELVKAMYKSYGEQIGFVHYTGIENIVWQQAFVSEAQLLWMRREPHNENDVIKWFQEIMQ